jgi:hypothetical protein
VGQLMHIEKREDGRYYKPCPECGEMQNYLRKNYAYESLRLNKSCKKCSNKKDSNCNRGWYKGIRISWFNKFKTSAETRGIQWDITIDDIAEVMKTQNYKCKLTNLDIEFPKSGHPQKSLASIDRIDSKKGYIKNNIQLVLKDINMMKQSYSQEHFIKMCKYVAENMNTKNYV